MIVTDSEEFPSLEVPQTPLWSENYAFTCNDANQGIGLIANLGRSCAYPDIWREAITIALPGERIICIKNYGRNTTATVASAAMFQVEVVTIGQTIRIRYDGPAVEQSRQGLLSIGFRPGPVKRCRFEIVFDGVAPVWNISGDTGHSTDIAGKMHIEQIGRGDGFIEVDDERFDIRGAFTNRDHSRGVRNLDAFKRSCWAQGYFPGSDTAFSVYAIEMFGIDGLAMSNASITRGGRRYATEVQAVELIQGVADERQSFNIRLTSELGVIELCNVRTLTSSVLSVVSPWDMFHGILPGVPTGLLLEESVIWDRGNEQGSGWSERCIVHEPFGRFN
jgi:hypothetical protein